MSTGNYFLDKLIFCGGAGILISPTEEGLQGSTVNQKGLKVLTLQQKGKINTANCTLSTRPSCILFTNAITPGPQH